MYTNFLNLLGYKLIGNGRATLSVSIYTLHDWGLLLLHALLVPICSFIHWRVGLYHASVSVVLQIV